MLAYDSLEEFRDPRTYDLECDAADVELPLIEEWARSLGGPLSASDASSVEAP